MLSLLIAMWFAAASDIQASEDSVQTIRKSVSESTPAKQLIRTAPEYPWSELNRGREAWVHVTYCVDESGDVQNVSILDSTGSKRFETAAIDTVKSWEFEPATKNGKPAWQSRNEVYIRFAISNEELGASPKFVRQFRKLNKLLENQELEKADELFWKVYHSSELSLYELGKLWSQRVRYEGMVGDYYRLNLALMMATASNGEWIEEQDYVRLLNLRVRVELQLGKYREAMRSFRKLEQATNPESEAVIKLQPTMDKLKAMIDSESVLAIQAEVRPRGDCTFCNDSWDFTPVRNDFQILNITGTLNSIDMRCDNKRFESKVSDNVAYKIADDWGKCHVQIYGEPGTTFEVLMLPASES